MTRREGAEGSAALAGTPGSPRMAAPQRRRQLVDVGLDLLATRSIQDLALDEVAAAAGVSRTLVFHYFPSKGDYFAAVVSSAGDRLMQAVPSGPETDVGALLRLMVTSFLGFVERKRGAYVALVRGASGGDPSVLAALDEVRANHVLRWLDAAQWPRRDSLTRLVVRGWLGALEEVALAAPDCDVPREVVVEQLVEGLLADLERAAEMSETAPVEEAQRA